MEGCLGGLMIMTLAQTAIDHGLIPHWGPTVLTHYAMKTS